VECKLSKFLEHNTVQLLRNIMSVVSVDEINQENICCLNTALVVCVHAHKKGELQDYLSAIREWEASNGQPGAVTSNFHQLIGFWRQYYSDRHKDCQSLEFSSRVPFSEWKQVVEELCNVGGCSTLREIT